MIFVFAYTFSKSYEQNHFLSTQNPSIGNIPLQGRLIKELDYQDKPRTIAFSGVWDLPLGKNGRFFPHEGPIGGALLNGWSFDWMYTYTSGYPTGKPNALFSCSSYVVEHQTPNQWFNNDPSCYPPYTLRNVEDRFSNIRDPQNPQLNIALQKTLPISEAPNHSSEQSRST
jgi:hypothetical protein